MWHKPFAWFLFGISLVCNPCCGADEPGLLGHWKFDQGRGDVVVDSSGHENDGEIWDAEWVRGKFGTALRFDGRGSYVAIPEIAGLDGSDELTVDVWVYWEGTGRYPNILSGGTWSPGGFLLFVQDNQCSFRMGRPGLSATGKREQWREVSAGLLAPFELGRWYHLAATFDRPVIKTYVNGRQVGTANWDYPVGYKNDLIIGKWGGALGHKGLIDEVRLFNRALDGERLAADYEKGLPGRAIGPGALREGQAAYETIPRTSQLAAAVAVFENDFAKLAVSSGGRCTALIDKSTGEDRILRTAPLVSIQQDGTNYTRAACSLEDGKLVFRFAKAETTVVVDVTAKPKYFVFRIDSVSTPDVDAVTFLRLNLKSCEHVDAMSGLAADDRFGVCVRTLNLATHVQVGRNPPVLTATVSQEHGIGNGQAAIVACPTAQLLPVLQDLVQSEGLPYSPLGGPFALEAKENRGSYVFARVSEHDVDRWIALAQRSGIRTIHMSGWQQSLGHYEPQPALFPHGLDGLKTVVDRLHAAGLKVGIHTLTGCIGTNDPWVRPVPDPRLATDGTFTLTADLSQTDANVPTVEPPGDYPTVWAYSSRGNCIRIDDELILYSVISNDSTCGFFQCKRGAFGTKAAAHAKGSPVHHMIARYGCFIPDEHSTLVDEVADAIANVYNTCGMDQIYMDGAEAMRGWYGIARMRQAIFTRLERPALVEASCWDHHSWPFHSRIGAWDHPKWGLKRFADDHLAAVERYRLGALLEAQLGWWVILGPSRDWDMEMPDEIEYLCAKALGHDVPLSFQSITTTDNPPNARQDEYLTTIGRYERLRLANYFSEDVKEKLREPRQEFRLTRAGDGQWQFLPTDYLQHKVTGPNDGTWSVTNRFQTQPVKLRLEALYSAFPYDDPQSMEIGDFSKAGEFSPAGAAPRVSLNVGPVASPPDLPAKRPGLPDPKTIGEFTAANAGDSPIGAWARAVKSFDPVVNMTPHDAIGLWVHGDGKGEVLNLQLTNLPEYFRTSDDHYVKIDFEGWRYFELLLRERDAAAYHDYQWPYGAHCVLHRSPLVRPVVNKLTAYLNNLPAGDDVTCYLSPVRALRTRKIVMHHPTIEIDGRRMVFPVDLESGMTIEFESPDDCRVYDERGKLLQWLRPEGDVATLSAGENRVAFSCEGPDGFRSRMEITLVACGPPIRGRVPHEQVDWSLLNRDYEYPRTICRLDGVQNVWQMLGSPGSQDSGVQIELTVDQVGSETAAYDAPTAVTIESFDQPDENGSFVFDAQAITTGCLSGVTQQLTRSSDVAKVGPTSVCYTATSTRDDNGGWSVKGRRLQEPLDLSRFAAIGFWLHGDAGGEQFKLQLHDASGGWQDMVTPVNFHGWRYCRFDLGGPRLKDLSRINAVNIYYNGIPARKTVTCHVDEIRVIQKPEPIRDPEFHIAGQRIRFPVAMNAGDRLVANSMEDCRLYRRSGEVEQVTPDGRWAALNPGRNTLVFTLPDPVPVDFRIVAALSREY